MKNRLNLELLEIKLKEQGWMSEKSSIILINKDCVVTETFSDKTYSYRIINYVSGEQKYLFHKKQSIKSEAQEVIEKKIETFESYGTNYPKSEIKLIRFIFEVVFKSFGFSIKSE
jgi:hypothetical protein